LFKQSIGLTPHQYVIQCRVEAAKHLLRQGELTIAEIADSLALLIRVILTTTLRDWL